jgi:predicted phosphodiesterase
MTKSKPEVFNPRKRHAIIAAEALRRFPNVSTHSLASYLIKRNKGLFSGHDHARQVLRYASGRLSTGQSKFKIAKGVPLGAGKASIPRSVVLRRGNYALSKGTWGILSDLHIPKHEQKPIEAVCNWFHREKVTGILLNGDAQDCDAISCWLGTDRRDFLEEVEMMIDFLDFLKNEFPKAKIVWKPGNHEERLQHYYSSHAPQLIDAPSASLQEILALDKRNIEFLDYKQRIVANELTILHGHEMRGAFTPVNAAEWALRKAKACVAIGHFHQKNEATKKTVQRDYLSAWSFGCLCDLEPDYNPYGNDWTWGAAILHFCGKNWEMDNRKILPTGKLL